MLRHRHQLRRWAARALIVWLFGVVAGVANACMAPTVGPPAGSHHYAAVSQAAVEAGCGFHEGLEQVEQGGAAGPHESHAIAACQAFCDGVSVKISQLKSPVDTTPSPAMAAPPYALALPVAGSSPVHLLMPRRDGGLAPPITIAFLRLTL